MGRALAHRNFRLFFYGQSISLVGTWMTRIATGWLVYRLTGSALMLGIVGFAGQFPSFLLAPFAGVFIDRTNKHHLLIFTQVLAMVHSFALAVLTLTNLITIWQVVALSIFQGLINAFDMPTRQSLLVELIEDKDDLSNAIALNSSMVNAARLIGPSIGGMLIAAVGEGWCFMTDAVSYIAVLGSLCAIKITARPRQSFQGKRVWHELSEGWTYVSRSRLIRSILLLLALVSLVGMPYTVLMPVMADKVLEGGPNTLGLMMAATGVGALIGALVLAARRSVLHLGKYIPLAAIMFGTGLVLFAMSRSLWLSIPLLVVTGLGFITQLAVSNTLLQTIVDEDKRGRVMSYYVMAFMGTAPFGSLLAGTIAERWGAPLTLAIGGMGCVLGGIWFFRILPELREELRPIYRKKGILPEIATGIQEATELRIPPE
ncbi:enterobactin exporter EntS [Bythopirellula polymerisocia]|uniref:Enterobactin exporter EntS n=2 Tax=Bythopirellula polymerisocia TaxID=2528003 RepID=A0A5C6CYQ5_9BACT|nr:enterobactin exporter EntS [Bythopirellula polymerisocia]